MVDTGSASAGVEWCHLRRRCCRWVATRRIRRPVGRHWREVTGRRRWRRLGRQQRVETRRPEYQVETDERWHRTLQSVPPPTAIDQHTPRSPGNYVYYICYGVVKWVRSTNLSHSRQWFNILIPRSDKLTSANDSLAALRLQPETLCLRLSSTVTLSLSVFKSTLITHLFNTAYS